MTVSFTLWLITSAYAAPLGAFPSGELCAFAALGLYQALQKPPRPVLAKLACVPTVISGRAGRGFDIGA